MPSPPRRAITAPTRNEPAFIIDDAFKSDTNPAGLVSCSVRVWQYAHGQWFPITGVARWDEFAPIKTVWVDNQPTDRKALDKSGRWGDMPFLMLAKCAEAQAIRKGWPEDLSNTFVGEEIEQAALTLHPAQAAAEGATRERLERIVVMSASLRGCGSTPVCSSRRRRTPPRPERTTTQKGTPVAQALRTPRREKKRRTKLSMPYWYGDERCILEIMTGTAIWYHSGLPRAPIRWVLVRDPTGVRDPQAFLCTDLDATPVEFWDGS